jgi:hypothetical protein
MGMQYDVKSAFATADAALVAYRVRIKGVFYAVTTARCRRYFVRQRICGLRDGGINSSLRCRWTVQRLHPWRGNFM